MSEVAELVGRIAVVTGAASGFGTALARELASAGMAVAVLDIDTRAGEQTAAALRSEGFDASAFPFDAGDRDSIAAAARAVDETYGGCDVLCANVGVQQFGSIDRLTDDDWTWVLRVNVQGTVRTVDAFLPLLRQRTGWRHITLTASTSYLVPGVRLGAYTTSKFAVVGFGETLRLELADEGIGVTILLPAGMATRHLESSASARPPELGPSVTLPDDVEAMLAGSATDLAGEIATPDVAARHVLAQVVADEPYVITHGDVRAAYEDRRAAVDRALDNVERLHRGAT
jgi:NAD(P)-dependent dehydrogenase (short-subunit alcohol dehydrogenase family)